MLYFVDFEAYTWKRETSLKWEPDPRGTLGGKGRRLSLISHREERNYEALLTQGSENELSKHLVIYF